jgi:hypothetical protein
MLLSVLVATSGFVGFILEHYYSFLTELFSFAKKVVAFGCFRWSVSI